MLTLKNLKIAKNLSQETLAYTADVYWEGRLIGHIRNDGGGGMSIMWPGNGRRVEDLKAATDFATAQVQDLGEGYGKVPFTHLEDYVDQLAGEQGDRQDAKRWLSRTMKTKVAIVADGKVRTLNASWDKEEASVRAYLSKNHPDAVILNAIPVEDAVSHYLATAA